MNVDKMRRAHLRAMQSGDREQRANQRDALDLAGAIYRQAIVRANDRQATALLFTLTERHREALRQIARLFAPGGRP